MLSEMAPPDIRRKMIAKKGNYGSRNLFMSIMKCGQAGSNAAVVSLKQ